MINVEGDISSRTFSFFYESDTKPAPENSKDYEITVSAVTGNVVEVSNTAKFTLKVTNPCSDNSYVSIVAPDVPTKLDDYTIFHGA